MLKFVRKEKELKMKGKERRGDISLCLVEPGSYAITFLDWDTISLPLPLRTPFLPLFTKLRPIQINKSE